MAELAMLADIQRTVYPEGVTRQLHVMAQVRESLPIKTNVLTNHLTGTSRTEHRTQLTTQKSKQPLKKYRLAYKLKLQLPDPHGAI